MKSLILCLFLINILSIFNLVSGRVSNDCYELNVFLNRDPNTPCCKKKKITNIICDMEKDYITRITLGPSDVTPETNFMRFPIFDRLTDLSIGIPNLNNNILPTRFFDQPMLRTLSVYESNITSIPEIIKKDCPVVEINLEHNLITEFPYQFSSLPKLQNLDVGTNQIEDMINIPSALEVLVLNNTQITEIPPDLFKLNNISRFHISNNPQLNANIINFGRNIEECSFEGTNISCLQPNTCKLIDESQYKPCSEDQINEIKNKQSKTPLQTNNKSTPI
ncbi:L domain-like protein [Anaeromyces robustus]|uniref:L domain-like protein n=1 Tax=Anaeromyces robustus TaxID=1754192 RepID=A0A1Y1X9Q0_9FUNG|nr:L domain-like protein [Anaeromyces robustus]|eukprot:ORX82472.1 L domain-like protein [Anaeromyces robustus]